MIEVTSHLLDGISLAELPLRVAGVKIPGADGGSNDWRQGLEPGPWADIVHITAIDTE